VLTNNVRRGRIYLPLDELEMAGLFEEDIFNGCVTDEWRSFMRARSGGRGHSSDRPRKVPPSSTRRADGR
jgi:hypothetical protein